MWSNYHTHSHYCDGKGSMRDYLTAAREKGLRSIGFSSHAPLPFPCSWSMKREGLDQYLAEINSVRSEFSDIEIYAGLEVDFIPNVISADTYGDKLDYTIGSIHFVDSFQDRRWEIDNTLEVFRWGLSNIFDNDVRRAIERYYSLTEQMLKEKPPDVLGHMDKIKMHNSQEVFFAEDDEWYRSAVDRLINTISSTGVIVEVNTRGLYKKKSPTTYPSPWVLERLANAQIPITLSSDAHHPDDLIKEFSVVLPMLKDCGFRNLSVLQERMWKPISIEQYAS